MDVYQSTHKTLATLLNEGLPDFIDDPQQYEKWRLSLDEPAKKYIENIIHASIIQSVYGMLVLLDSLKGGFPIKDQVSDFALYLQTYPHFDALTQNQPSYRVRFNALKDIELHDLFLESLEEIG